MKRGLDLSSQFPGLMVIHQNVPAKKHQNLNFSQAILFVPLQGEITITTSSQKHTFGPGRVLLLPPDTKHDFHSSEQSGERLIALLEPKKFKSLKLSEEALLVSQQLVKELLFYLLLEPSVSSARKAIGLLEEVLRDLATQRRSFFEKEQLEAKCQSPELVKVLEFVEKHYSQGLRMSQIARASGLSLRSLNRKCLEELGLNPKTLLSQIRIQEACTLLQQGKHTVLETSLACGFGSLSTFIAQFRQSTGLLPSDYLRSGGNSKFIGQK